MSKYNCDNCNNDFDEQKIIKTTYEAYYGVLGLFDNTTPLTLETCPKCGDTDIELSVSIVERVDD